MFQVESFLLNDSEFDSQVSSHKRQEGYQILRTKTLEQLGSQQSLLYLFLGPHHSGKTEYLFGRHGVVQKLVADALEQLGTSN